SILLEKNGQRLAFVRRDEGWVIASAGGAPAKTAALRQLLLDLAAIEKLEPRTDDPALYDRLGLTDQALRIALGAASKEAAGKEKVLYLGKSAGGGADRRFARVEGEARAWLVKAALEPELQAGRWADLALPTMPRADVRALTITQADGERLDIGRDSAQAENFAIRNLAAGEEPAYPTVANGIAGALASLGYEDVRRADDLDFSNPVIARYEDWDGFVLTLRLVQADGGWWLRVAAQAPGGDGASDPRADKVNALSQWAFKLPDYKAEDLTKRKTDLLKASQ
ncbi:MAG: DUF4340 domain-containing protein, partial [Alphaproteobacteria bacterium]